MNDGPAANGAEQDEQAALSNARPVGSVADGAAEARMHAALQQMSIGVSAAEISTGAFVFLNDTGAQILGSNHAPTDLAAYTGFGAQHADGTPYAAHEYPLARAAIDGEVVTREPMIYRRPDGRIVRLEVSAGRVHDESGAPLLAICSFEDVTERERVMNLLETFTQAVPGVVYAKDRQGRMLIANRGVAELVGKPLPEILGRTDIEFLDDQEQGAAVMETDERVMRSGETEQIEEDVSFPDGRRAIWLSTKAPLRDDDGAVVGLIGASIDITARKEAEAALAESEERFRFALEAAGGIGTWDWDIASDTIRTSAQFARMYGVDPERALGGLPLNEYVEGIHSDDRARVSALIEEAIAGADDLHAEYRILTVDGTVHWVVARGRCFRNEAGEPTRFPGVTFDITERRRAEDELRETEERYRLAALATNDAVWDWHFDTNHVLWNDALQERYGHDPAVIEPSGDWWIAQIHPEDRERIDHGIHVAIDGEADSWTDEYRFACANGDYAYVQDRGHIIRDKDGRAIRMIGAMLDLTEQRRSERALREATSRLEAILANTRMAVFLMDDRQHCVFANAAAEQLTGFSFAQMQGRPLHDVIHHKKPDGSYYPLEECPIDRAFPERAQMDGEELFVSPGGTLYPVAFTASPLLDDGGQPFGTVIEARPIAEERAEARRQAFRLELVDALRNADEPREIMQAAVDKLGRFLNVTRVGYGLVREDGETVDLETEYLDGARPLAGSYPLQDFGAANIANLRSGRTSVFADVEADEGTAGSALGQLDIVSLVSVPLLGNGQLRAAIYVNHDRPREWHPADVALIEEVASRVWDAVERARATDQLRALNADLEQRIAAALAQRDKAEEELRQSQKMEAVGQLTGGIAHDFNNLLTVVTGNIEMATRALNAAGIAEPRAQRTLGNAMKGAERAAALTQRLLAFSRRQPLAPKLIDADRLVAGMSDMLNRALGETVQLEIVTSPGLWRTEADPNQLESAILNLAVNARDAMPSGGTLTIETANARLDDEYAAQHAEVAPGQYVVIAVTDTGDGMSRDTLSRVFEPFFTTKEVGRGTGLGLSQVYGFTKQSGGHVKVYSEEGQGTTVKIYLPRVISEDEAEPDAPEGALEVSRAKETILAVEDDDDVRSYTVECLRELGYRVLEAHDGPSALRLVERSEETIDLLFTDVVMPGMSGRELADELRRKQPDLRVLYTSGYTRNAIVHGGRLDEGVEMIPKPFTYQALGEKLRDVLEAGRTKRVLVVEDEPTLRAFVVEALAGCGYAADEAATAAEALMTLRAAQGRYDAVVLDTGLPDKHGEALAGELRALYADLPILLASDVPEKSMKDRLAHDRCIAVLQKPYSGSQLVDALRTLGMRCGSGDH